MIGTWLIFTITSLLRHNVKPTHIAPCLQHLHVALRPRIHAWLAVLRTANLLTYQQQPAPVFYQWLGWQPVDQYRHLFEAWQTAPNNNKNRQLRKRITQRLAQGKTLHLSDQRAFPILPMLGICQQEDGRLSPWGEVVLGLRTPPTPTPPAPWQLGAKTLTIPHPVHWPLLLRLEQYLVPSAVLEYQLDAALQNLCKSAHDRLLFGSCFFERCLKPGLTCSLQA